MNPFESWVLTYLLNSVWQVPLLLIMALLAAKMTVAAGPRLQHRIWVTTLLLQVLVPACPVTLLNRSHRLFGWLVRSPLTGNGDVRVLFGSGSASDHNPLRLPASMLTCIAVLYGCGLLYFALRLAWGLWKTEDMRQRARPVLLEGEAAVLWHCCLDRLQRSKPTLAISPDVSGPVTLGVLHDTLLIPPALFEQVAAEDLEAIFAHEAAHMRRHDFLKNLLYEALSLPIAYHPALWFTRSYMAVSREIVCDDMAAGVALGAERYARSLLRLASMLVQDRPLKTFHAIGIFDANQFERRIMNLTEKSVVVQGVRRAATVAVCAVIGLATCASALALRVDINDSFIQQTSSSTPARVSGGVMAGNNLTKVNPVYPPDAKEAKITGAVVLRAVIGKDGSVEQLQVVSGPEALRKSSLDAVRQWTYKPYLLNGRPTDVDTTITVNYSLSK